jgi:hypothetical protein
LTAVGVSPYSILMGNDDHAGTSRDCPRSQATVDQAKERSTELLNQAAESVVSTGTPVSTPSFTTNDSTTVSNACLTITGLQDLPGLKGPQVAAKLNAAWSTAGYTRVSASEFTTPDGYSITLGETNDGRYWLSSTSPPASP